jgi:hypothetical protein
MFNLFPKKKTKEFVPRKYAVYNVDVFNAWWNDPDNGAIYAHPGIYLRTDKLGYSHITEYLQKCHNINLDEWDCHDENMEFYQEIFNNWIQQLRKKK